MKQFKPFKLTFKYALQKAYNYWKRGVLQIQRGSQGRLMNEYGKCAIGCSLPTYVLKKAEEKNENTPAVLKKKGLIKANTNDIRKLTKMMKAHDSGKDAMREFFIQHKILRR